MALRNPPSYDGTSRVIHWLTAIAATIAFVLGPEHFGRLIRDGVDPASRRDIVWHESLGIMVLALTVARLAWMAVRPRAPRFPMPDWMRIASRVVHVALLALLLALPASAFLALGSESHPLTLLGGLRLDRMPFIETSSIAGLADWGDVHKLLGDTLIWLAGLHAAAAIFHHAVLKDDVLRAMLAVRRRRP